MEDNTITDAPVVEEAEQSTTPETIESSAESLRSDSPQAEVATPEKEDNNEAEQSTTSTDEQTSTDDQELIDWAEKTGLDTKDQNKILKALRDTQKKLHETTSQVSTLKKNVNEDIGSGSDQAVVQEARILNFYNSNPEARALDKEMGEIYSRYRETDSAFADHLLVNLDTLHRLAKAESAETREIAARQKGKEDAIKQTKQAQASSAPRANAVTSAPEKTEMTSERVNEIIASGKYNDHQEEILAWEKRQYGL